MTSCARGARQRRGGKYARYHLQSRNWPISSRSVEASGASSLSGRSPASRGACAAPPARARHIEDIRPSWHMPAKAKRPKRPTPRSCLGPVADLEAHLPAEWWRKLFNALYVKTDGDVVENVENTRREVDFIVARGSGPAAQPDPRSVLRPGPPLPRARAPRLQERHRRRPLALSRAARQEARAGRTAAGRVQGRRRAQSAAAREQLRLRRHHGQLVRLLLQQAGRREGADRGRQDPAPSGQLVLDITDGAYMADHFERRSWEWIDEHHFVCRERSLVGRPANA